MIRRPDAERFDERIFARLADPLAPHDRRRRPHNLDSLRHKNPARQVIDEVDAVPLVGIGSPCQFFDRRRRIVGGIGEARMRRRIGMKHPVHVAESGVIEPRAEQSQGTTQPL